MASVPISILDLAAVGEGESIAESFAGSVRLAQTAEQAGYKRVWYAEHHNISAIREREDQEEGLAFTAQRGGQRALQLHLIVSRRRVASQRR